jgi:acetylornithine/N-succinyldiaminopimelate aminotransferase
MQLSQPGRPFVELALERGLLINCTSETVLRLLPPYIISRQEVAQTIDVLDEVLRSREPGGRS